MDLASIDIVARNALAGEFDRRGVLVLQSVQLPNGFNPSVTDVVFVATQEGCEVYIDAHVAYLGADELWRSVCASAEMPGNTRLVLTAVDFFSALRRFREGLRAEHCAPTPVDDSHDRWLRVLGLNGCPTVDEIKRAFRKLALICHPDMNHGSGASQLNSSNERMIELVNARNGLLESSQSDGQA